MIERKRPQAYRVAQPGEDAETRELIDEDDAQTVELREEELVAHTELRDLGEIEVRTEVDEVPGRLEVDAYREEVVVEHEPVGQMVSAREKPWEEDGVLIIPVYEEQLVVSKRLVLKERMRVRRVGTTERQLFQDTLRRERLVIDDPRHTGLVREQYPTDGAGGTRADDTSKPAERSERPEPAGGFLENMVRKALE